MEHSLSPLQNARRRRGNVLFSGFARAWFCAVFFALIFCARADDFGDVGVSADAMYSGNTYHGYGETRVTVENHSRSKNHTVTLIVPNQPWANGNSISRLSRSVDVAPGAIKIVSLLQPPLPLNGDNRIRVEVDHGEGGEITAPRNAHCQFSPFNRNIIPNIFISRSLDFDAVEGIFNHDLRAFTAEMAVGMPDSGGTTGRNPNAWMPDTRAPGATNWLELDFTPSLPGETLDIYHTIPLPPSGEIVLMDDSGAVLDRISMSASKGSHGRHSMPSMQTSKFFFPEPTNNIKTVRLNFGAANPETISIDAVELSGSSGRRYASAARASSDDHASAAASASASSGSFAPRFAGRFPGRVGAPESIQALRSEMAISDWSENWLAYTPFDGIALSAADVAALPPAVASALSSYLFAGGNLFIFGDKATLSLPESWRSTQKDFSGSPYLSGVGFGHCIILPTPSAKTQLDFVTLQILRGTVRDEARYWAGLPDSNESANATFPIVKNVKIPARGIVAFMLLFIILVGPVNIFILKRRKNGTAILWTIPAISIVTTLALFAYSLLREGITPDTRITGLTFIEQSSHRATTVGASAFYCPLTPSGGLVFDYGTEVTPLVSLDMNFGTQREMDWTQAQHLQSGWVSARVPAIFHLRKSEIRRERLQVVNENGQIKIVNGLGAPIQSLWFAAPNGKIYRALDVPAGQMATLTGTADVVGDEQLGPYGLLRDDSFAMHDDSLSTNAEKYLMRGSYVAQLQGNPFIENSLASSVPKRSKIESVVFGLLEPQENR
jgi:hypothetical protein